MHTVTGSKYGIADYTLSPRVGYSPCESSTWTSDSALVCKIAAGNAYGQAITLTLLDIPASGPRLSTWALMWSYNAPTNKIGPLYDSQLQSCGANAPRFSISDYIIVPYEFTVNPNFAFPCSPESTKKSDFYVNGTSFGLWDSSPCARLGGTAVHATQ